MPRWDRLRYEDLCRKLYEQAHHGTHLISGKLNTLALHAVQRDWYLRVFILETLKANEQPAARLVQDALRLGPRVE